VGLGARDAHHERCERESELEKFAATGVKGLGTEWLGGLAGSRQERQNRRHEAGLENLDGEDVFLQDAS
jgi:hypothetical protein